MTPEEQRIKNNAALAALDSENAPYTTEGNTVIPYMKKAGTAAKYLLDAPGGVSRALITKGLRAPFGGVSPEYTTQLKAALVGQGEWPSGAKSLQELGVLKAGEEPSPGSLGGLVGLGAEALTDPWSLATLPGRAGRMVSDVKNVPGKVAGAAERVGQFFSGKAPAAGDLIQRGAPVAPLTDLAMGAAETAAKVDSPLVAKIKSALGFANDYSLKLPSTLMGKSGKRMYSSSVPDLAMLKDNQRFADAPEVMQAAGIWGTPRRRMAARAKGQTSAGADMGLILDDSATAGGMVNLGPARAAAQSHADSLVERRLMSQEEADGIVEHLFQNSAPAGGGASVEPSVANQVKTQLQRGIPKQFWEQTGMRNQSSYAKEIANKAQAEVRDALHAELDKTVGPEARAAFEKAAHTYATLKEVGKPLKQAAIQEARTPIWNMWDPLVLSGEMQINPTGTPGAVLLAKKAAEMSSRNTLKSGLGSALINAEKNPWVSVGTDNLSRRAILNLMRPPEELP